MMKKPALLRHVLIIGTSVLTGYLLLASRAEWSEMHRYNRALGDLSLLLIVAAMAIGPLARLSSAPFLRKLMPYRRELGIYAVLAATVHTIIILIGWVELDFARLFGFEYHPQLQRYVMLQHGFALANVVGIAALLYGFVLAGTSNNSSQRVLGTSVWKYIQQGAYVGVSYRSARGRRCSHMAFANFPADLRRTLATGVVAISSDAQGRDFWRPETYRVGMRRGVTT